jgi:hypothetical protein
MMLAYLREITISKFGQRKGQRHEPFPQVSVYRRYVGNAGPGRTDSNCLVGALFCSVFELADIAATAHAMSAVLHQLPPLAGFLLVPLLTGCAGLPAIGCYGYGNEYGRALYCGVRLPTAEVSRRNPAP